MKKIITICLMITMVIGMSLGVCAEVGGFIQSPSNNQAPEIIEAENEAEDCEAVLIITAYADRDELPEEAKAKIEQAYDLIKSNPDLSALNEEVQTIAENLGIDVADLAVSDMFDISATDCNGHEDHGHFDITLKSDTLKNFVCLLHYYNGEWRIVENAEITNNGTHLEFDEDEFSPFAIVVNTNAEQVVAPQNGDNHVICITVAAILGLLAIILAIILVATRKNKKA